MSVYLNTSNKSRRREGSNFQEMQKPLQRFILKNHNIFGQKGQTIHQILIAQNKYTIGSKILNSVPLRRSSLAYVIEKHDSVN